MKQVVRRALQKTEPLLRKAYKKMVQSPVPNLAGDRDIEYSWVAAQIPDGPGMALDFGAGMGYMGLMAARKEYTVTALDLLPEGVFYKHANLTYEQGDLLTVELPDDHFDLIINCSVIEHVGLVGRYGTTKPEPDGDLEAMTILKQITKPGKSMILTIPVGKDHVFDPLHRIYGSKRLPLLLDGWDIGKQEYWLKNGQNQWVSVAEAEAIHQEPTEHFYGLGLFVLTRPIKNSV